MSPSRPPPAHRAATAPLPLAAEEEGAEVRGEAAVMEGQEIGLGEAKSRRELPHQLPRAVQEQQENGGLGGGGHTHTLMSPTRDGDGWRGRRGGSHLFSGAVAPEEPQPAGKGVPGGHPLPLHQALEAGQAAGAGVPQELHQRGQQAVQVPVRRLWGGGTGTHSGEGGVPIMSHTPLHPGAPPTPAVPCRRTEQRLPASSDATSAAFLKQVLGGKKEGGGSGHPKTLHPPARGAAAHPGMLVVMAVSPHAHCNTPIAQLGRGGGPNPKWRCV